MFANRISSSTSCSIWPPETSPPSSSRDVLRHRFQSCNTSLAGLCVLVEVAARQCREGRFCIQAFPFRARISTFADGNLRRERLLSRDENTNERTVSLRIRPLTRPSQTKLFTPRAVIRRAKHVSSSSRMNACPDSGAFALSTTAFQDRDRLLLNATHLRSTVPGWVSH